jgi:phospholipid/cholesterol/gamma-HCH transport system substrate-binding protein
VEPKVSYSLVGAFVIFFSAVLVIIVLWLARGGPQKAYQNYYAYFRQSVSGLNENAAVKYKGVAVGQVTDIRLDPQNPERVRLTLSIEKNAPIKEDTYATLSMQGLTGLAFVELSGGTRESPPLKAQAGVGYPVINTKPSLLMRLDEAATTLLANLNQIAGALAELSGKESRESIKTIMSNVAELSKSLRNREHELDRLFVNADHTLRNTSEITEKLPVLVSRLSSTAGAVENMAQQIAQASENFNAVLTGSRQDIRQFTGQTLSDLSSLVGELRELAAGLRRFADQVEQNPKSLLFGRRPPSPGPGE